MLLVGVIVLMVWPNMANLLLSRAVGRERESAVRLALGAARTRVFRQRMDGEPGARRLGGGVGVVLGFTWPNQSMRCSRRDAVPRTLSTCSSTSGYGVHRCGSESDGVSLRSRARAAGRARRLRRVAQNADPFGDWRGTRPSSRTRIVPDCPLSGGARSQAFSANRWRTSNRPSLDSLLRISPASVNPARTGYSRERVGPYVLGVSDELTRLPGVAE